MPRTDQKSPQEYTSKNSIPLAISIEHFHYHWRSIKSASK